MIAPDKFKGSLTAIEATEAIERGIERAVPNARCRRCPMADGGEGTVAVFLAHGAAPETVPVRGPRGGRVEATYARRGDTAIIEVAAASGLQLLDARERDPTNTDTYGTGQLIEAALDRGARHLIAGIGGSATNDAGTGMLRALGVRFFAANGEELGDGILSYDRLQRIDTGALDARLRSARIEVAVDVDNPLTGPNGAARTFAAQKGATGDQIEQLDGVLQRIAEVSAQTLGRDYASEPGAGAAGGLGFAFVAFLGAQLKPGVRLIARETGLDTMLADATLCMTGEGKIDLQTLHGKTVAGVADLARERHIPVIAFGGIVEDDAARELAKRGVECVAIAPTGTSRDDAMRGAARFLEGAAAAAIKRALVVKPGGSGEES